METKASILQEDTHKNSPWGSNQKNNIIWFSNEAFCLWPVTRSVHVWTWSWP